MIQFLLAVIAILTTGIGVFFLIARHQKKRADRAEAEAVSLREAFRQAEEKAGRLRRAQEKQTKAEVKANEERKELSNTADSDLVRRANGLFGVRDKSGPGSAAGN
jgi:Tfp pilus assembly protein PilO